MTSSNMTAFTVLLQTRALYKDRQNNLDCVKVDFIPLSTVEATSAESALVEARRRYPHRLLALLDPSFIPETPPNESQNPRRLYPRTAG